MELKYKIPTSMWRNGIFVGNYLLGLQDAGTIEAYNFENKNFWQRLRGYSSITLTIELLDETRREKIDASLRERFEAQTA
ncbi:MAG: hypothetical protein HYW24_00110 [Candidatus Aenigmarchaeota archaeon]|nr:hypothetical protein [Candidatus Aenigmarchaeota archaeon]